MMNNYGEQRVNWAFELSRQTVRFIDLVGLLPCFLFLRFSRQELDAELVAINPHQLATPIRKAG